ncbi:MAG: proteasome assembly chaperone family protein [Candidatus Odinarchaeia archaeon]
MSDEIKIKEETKIPEDSIILFGLPDTGLVGVISANHILENKKMRHIGSIDSSYFPPMVVIHEGKITPPTRIYGGFSNIYSIISEIALPVNGINQIVNGIVEWLEEKKPKLVLFLGGIPVPNRINIDQPKCYTIPSNEKTEEIVKSHGLELLVEGVMVGPYALLLKSCREKNIPAIALLGESFANYPDPGAAASIISSLNKLLNIDVDVKSLEESAEEIRIKMRDLMKRTTREMRQAEKSREYELPPLYM